MKLASLAAIVATAISAQQLPQTGDQCPTSSPFQSGSETLAVQLCSECGPDDCIVKGVALAGSVGEGDEGFIDCGCKEESQPLPQNGDLCPTSSPFQSGLDSLTVHLCSECKPNECFVTGVALADNQGNGGDDGFIDCGCQAATPPPFLQPIPQAGDACPTSSPFTSGSETLTVNFCPDDCEAADCVVEAVALAGSTGTTSPTGFINCRCQTSEPTPVPEVDEPTPAPVGCTPAYDDDDYCLCPGPNPSPTYSEKIEVSVCGDATYLLSNDVIPCSGPSDQAPAGTACPKQGDTTTIACRPEILSYLTGGSTGSCKAPEDATCEKLNTGAWGCVFPGNCNTVNTCLEENIVTEEYETNDDGTCKVGENGYPIPSANNTALYDTTQLSELQAKAPNSGANAMIGCWSLAAVAMSTLSTLF